MATATSKSQRLKDALSRFADIRERVRAKQSADERVAERCAALYGNMRDLVKREDIREAVEMLGDLAAFRHTDGNGNEILLLFSAQRDRVIINERYFHQPPQEVRREGSDVLLSISSIGEHDLSPDRCLVYQLLHPVEFFAVKRSPNSNKPRSFIEHHFGLVCSKPHMFEFINKLHDAAPNPNFPLPDREDLPAFIEEHIEETLAESIELRTGQIEDQLGGD